MRPIITALCSFGMSGEVFHAPFIANHSGFELKYVLERTKNLSQTKYPEVIVLRDFEDLLATPEIELVVINTPSQLHFEMAKKALEAGKHVVVEKPFTVYHYQGLELIDLAEKNNLLLAVFHNKRLEGEFKTVQKVVNEKLLGDVLTFESQFDRFRPQIGPKKWKEDDSPGAGILYDLGSHLIDQILILFGRPNALKADLQIQRELGKVIDFFKIDFYYSSFTATVKAGMLVSEIGPKYKIKGTKGEYIKYGVDSQEELLKQGHSPLEANWGIEAESYYGQFIDIEKNKVVIPTIQGSYMDFYSAVFDSVRTKVDFIIKPSEALQVIEIIEKSIESNNTKEVVLLV